MFVSDFQGLQGVLLVDTVSFSTFDVPASPTSTSSKIDFFPAIYGIDLSPQELPHVMCPSNVPVLKQLPIVNLENGVNSMQISNHFNNCQNENISFPVNSTAFVVMLNPGDAPPPNPH